MYPCFVLGVLIHNNLRLFNKHLNAILITSFSIFAVMLVFWDESFWEYHIGKRGFAIYLMRLGNSDIISHVIYILYYKYYRLAIGLFGATAFISLFSYLSKYIPQNIWGDKICEWGKYTLGIYILQTFILEIFLRKVLNCDSMNFYLFNFVASPIISVGVLLLSLWCIKMIHYSKWASWLMLGEKIPTTI